MDTKTLARPIMDALEEAGRGDYLEGAWSLRDSSNVVRGFVEMWYEHDTMKVETWLAIDEAHPAALTWVRYTDSSTSIDASTLAQRDANAKAIYQDWKSDVGFPQGVTPKIYFKQAVGAEKTDW